MSKSAVDKKVMTPADRLKVVKAFGKKSQEERMALLKRAGIINSKGELAKGYRPVKRKKRG